MVGKGKPPPLRIDWRRVRFWAGETGILMGLSYREAVAGKTLGPRWAALEGGPAALGPRPGPHPTCSPSLLPHLTTLHGTAQVAQQTICHSHVVLAHGPVLEAPAFAIVVDEFCGLTGEEQGFLVVLQGHREMVVGGGTLSAAAASQSRAPGPSFSSSQGPTRCSLFILESGERVIRAENSQCKGTLIWLADV